MSGKDWARYTYGAYLIVPSLVWLEHLLGDRDARAIERARLRTLLEEQRENADGSFFGKRFTQPTYTGQPAKYETDCYANLALAFCLHRTLQPDIEPTETEALHCNLSGRTVSHECGIATVRSPELFASFSWRALETPHPMALFVPIEREDLAEWQAHNLLGRVVTLARAEQAVWIRSMKSDGDGFRVGGTVIYRARDSRILYTDDLVYQVWPERRMARVSSRFVAKQRLFVRRTEGLHMAVANDRWNGFERTLFSDAGETKARFDPQARPRLHGNGLPRRAARKLLGETLRDGRRITIDSPWINIDDSLGVVCLDSAPGPFVLRMPTGRNLRDGSLHYDTLYCPLRSPNRRFQPEETIFESELLLIAGDRDETRRLAAGGHGSYPSDGDPFGEAL